MLSDQDFLRYQRQISLPDIGEEGQLRLSNSHVLMIGCGGLGSAVAMYLASAGVGKLVVVDDDDIETSNLQRQVIYRESQVGQAKVSAISDQIVSLNNACQVRVIDQRLEDTQLSMEIMLADVVIDCSDNFATRHQVNRTCYTQSTPLISASAIGWQGQFMVFDFPNQDSCYRCLFPFESTGKSEKCSDSGIVGPVVGTMGNLQALAAIQKLATGHFLLDTKFMKIFDGQSLNWNSLMMARDSQCEVCSSPLSSSSIIGKDVNDKLEAQV